MNKARTAAGLALVLILGAGCQGAGDETTDKKGGATDGPRGDGNGSAAKAMPEPQVEPAPAMDGGSVGSVMPPDSREFSDAQTQQKAAGQTLDEKDSKRLIEIGIPPVPDISSPGSKVIKNANVQIRIKKGEFQDQFNTAGQVAEELNGYVTNSSVNEVKGKVSSGTITIRVPADKFQAAVNRLKGLGKVTAEDQSGQDVSKEFVDLEARLRHAKAQEAFYLRLLDESKSVSDLVQVQQQLSNIQLQIEEIQGQLQYLKDQTVLSTITARIYEPGAALRDEPKGLGKAWQEAGDSFKSVVGGAVVALGWLAPFALVGLIGLGVYRVTRRPKVHPAENAS